jgi:hypothetical protein
VYDVTIPSLVSVTTVTPVVIGTVEQELSEHDVMVRTIVDFSASGPVEEPEEDGTSTISVTEESVPVVK